MQRKHGLGALVLIAFALVAPVAFASDTAEYAEGSGTELGRGVVNGAAGWIEVPKHTVIGGRDAGAAGVVGGFVKGVLMGVARTVTGASKIATFWAPVRERFGR